jgi:hypothetical protein
VSVKRGLRSNLFGTSDPNAQRHRSPDIGFIQRRMSRIITSLRRR